MINEYNEKTVDDTFKCVYMDVLDHINLLEEDLEKLNSNPPPHNPYVVNIDVDGKMLHLSYEESKNIYEGLIDSLKTMDISGKMAGVYNSKQIFRKEDIDMPSEMITYYCFGPLDGDGINVISYVNNVWAAKMAMLRMYGRKESDIKFSSSERKGAPVFDGRNFH